MRLAEFRELVTSASLVCAGTVVGSRERPHPRWFVGAGKVDEMQEAIAAAEADLVIFNHELTAIQQRNLETQLGKRVMTRTELILHIFADRARTGEGQLQVELAQLTHAQTRLIRGWTHLDRQKGGVNLRGAGETQLEMDQRMLAGRVRYVRDRLERVHRQRAQSRRRRNRARIPTVALAGYTNAGKSTLFNALTADGVHAADQMFATLDPTMRRWQVGPGAEVVLADTVGFIRELPVTLVDAFKATLEEIAEADLILHVIDASSPDAGLAEEVRRVLAEIGAADTPTIEVFNKVDLLEGDAHCLGGLSVSAIEGTGVGGIARRGGGPARPRRQGGHRASRPRSRKGALLALRPRCRGRGNHRRRRHRNPPRSPGRRTCRRTPPTGPGGDGALGGCAVGTALAPSRSCERNASTKASSSR